MKPFLNGGEYKWVEDFVLGALVTTISRDTGQQNAPHVEQIQRYLNAKSVGALFWSADIN
jgi:hypothetical protein